MFSDPNFRAQLRKALIAINAFLSLLLLVIVAIWFMIIRPFQIDAATNLGQYAYVDLNNLPSIVNKIEADYAGASQFGEEKSPQTNDDGDELVTGESEPTEILDKAEEILAKTNQILTDSSKNTGSNESTESIDKATPERKVPGKPRIAIIVTNLGLNKKSTELALTLPKQCGLGFLPYTKTLKPLLHQAQTNGHEIYLYLPLQMSRSYENPGKYALLGNLPPEDNLARLNLILNSHARYDGVYSSFKEVFTSNAQISEMLLDHLDSKNLIFVMGRVQQGHLPPHLKKRDNLVYTNIVIDKEPDEQAINNSLEKLIKTSKEKGVAIGYTQGFTLTIEMIRDWLPKLKDRGVMLVPISELLKEDKQ